EWSLHSFPSPLHLSPVSTMASKALRSCLLRQATSASTSTTTTQQRGLAIPADPLARFRQLANQTSASEKPRVLITGSLGQLGRGLATMLRFMYGEDSVVMTDIRKVRADETDVCNYQYLDILNEGAIDEAIVNGRVNTLIHFSALLSAVGENNVPLALQVNCQGVQNILEVAKRHSLKVFIPSTIGAFGPETPRVDTPDITVQRPKTIYGVSKVYAELLGEYYHHRFGVDFRSLRFPGIISATTPGGGTTDYAIKIFYDALKTGHHVCYLRPDTRLPMMYDTDCTASVLFFLAAQSSQLSMRTYNVTGFSFTPEEISASIRKFMPDFRITYEICPLRQKIADSWPQSLNDSIARADWAWKNDYGLDETTEIMIALIKREMARETEKPKAVNA
ncbi:hypothetical protein PFISCL1PPCAC_2974, partial [Pristionchus fissidentatus]